MNKFIAAIMAALICLSIIPLYNFNSHATSLSGVAESAWFSEPPDLPNTIYFILDDGNGDSQGFSAYLFILTFPFVPEEYFIDGTISVELICEQDGQTLRVLAPTLENLSFQCLVYKLNGSYQHRYDWTIPTLANQPFTYKFVFTSSYRYLWNKGYITPYLNNLYHPASIYFLDDYTYTAQLRTIITNLSNIYNNTLTLPYEVHSINEYWRLYYQAWDAWAASDLDALVDILSELSIIESKIDMIIELLGGGETTQIYPDCILFNSSTLDALSD